jgi:hypothetical protein
MFSQVFDIVQKQALFNEQNLLRIWNSKLFTNKVNDSEENQQMQYENFHSN